MENKITKIKAEEIKDSRGNPTIKVTVWIGEISDSFSVPSGASTGVHEACELRDEDGKGISDVINKINIFITRALVGQNILDQKGIDKIMMELDGTPNKSNLGGNAIIGVSIACAKVAAKVSNMEVFEYLRTLNKIKPSRNTPYLYMNLINGGKHTKTDLTFQEYHIVPNTQDVSLAFEIGIKFQNSLKEVIQEEFGDESITLGDEGGFAVKTNDIRKPLEIFSKVVKNNGLEGKIRFAIDVASSSFYKDGLYKVDGKDPAGKQASNGAGISKEDLKNIYDALISEFNLLSIEDPFNEEDFTSFKNLKESQKNLLVVGDDITVTNIALLKKAIEKGSINAMIIKPNQIGTLSETIETMKLARENNIELIVSHRSGETDDTFIADLAYAFGCFGLKAGSPSKPERRVKYERLIKISKI